MTSIYHIISGSYNEGYNLRYELSPDNEGGMLLQVQTCYVAAHQKESVEVYIREQMKEHWPEVKVIFV